MDVLPRCYTVNLSRNKKNIGQDYKMCFWFRKRKEKMKEAIQILIDYVEG